MLFIIVATVVMSMLFACNCNRCKTKPDVTPVDSISQVDSTAVIDTVK